MTRQTPPASSDARDEGTRLAERIRHCMEVEPDFLQEAETLMERWSASQPGAIAIDTETEGVAHFDAPFCVTVAFDADDGDYVGGYLELAEPRAAEIAREILTGTKQWVFHNAKFDLQKLILVGLIDREEIAEHQIDDTEAIAHLLNENQGKRLKQLAVTYLDWDDTVEVPLASDPERTRLVSEEKYVLDAVRRKLKLKKEDGYDKLPRGVVVPYAVADALMTIQLYDVLWPWLAAKDAELLALYQREMRLSIVLLDMERRGMRVDMPYVDKRAKELMGEMYRQEKTILKLSGRDEFIDHHEWIKPTLHDLGIEVPNTQADTLKEYKDEPIVEAILEFRRLKKLWDYFHAIQREQRDGILHPSFRQHGTVTGRMSSGEAQDG